MADLIWPLKPREHVEEALRSGHLGGCTLEWTLRTSLRDAAKEQPRCGVEMEEKDSAGFLAEYPATKVPHPYASL